MLTPLRSVRTEESGEARMKASRTLAAGLLATTAVVAAALPAVSTARDSRCSDRFGTINERVRYIHSSDPLGATLHDMSAYPTCAPSGPYLGTASNLSTFRLYYADTKNANWCYGYSPSLQRHGYVMCIQLKTTK